MATIGRMTFTDSSLDKVIFEGKTLAEVKAMLNYDRWGLAEDKIYTNAIERDVNARMSALEARIEALENNQ